MTDPTINIAVALANVVEAALLAAGYSDPEERIVYDPAHYDGPQPYTTFGDDTLISLSTKDRQGANVTHSGVCWSSSALEAKRMRAVLIEALTDKDNMPTITDNHTIGVLLDFAGPTIPDRQPDGTMYGAPWRVRILTQEGA